MTTISAKTILRSRNMAAPDLVLSTFLCRYPRWIHAEGRTHRLLRIGEEEDLEWLPRTPSLMEDPALSRNASSSRAIPVEKLIQDIIDDPAVPMFWGANQKGMQGGDECNAPILLRYEGTEFIEYTREQGWTEARNRAIELARAYAAAGYHKQIVNRLLEPFSHITVVVSGTEWANFRALRDHPAAEPHIRLLAQEIGRELDRTDSIQELKPGEWHMPFVDLMDPMLEDGSSAIKLSVARCASTSYKTVEGFDMTLERAIALHDKLVSSAPLHASPCEHVAQADMFRNGEQSDLPGRPFIYGWERQDQHANFVGFRQYRKMLPGESVAG